VRLKLVKMMWFRVKKSRKRNLRRLRRQSKLLKKQRRLEQSMLTIGFGRKKKRIKRKNRRKMWLRRNRKS
jgi:hypothetical protein